MPRYLTTAEYINRFGNAETVRLTDEAKSGMIDGAKLETAINDSEEESDGYIGRRYAVPMGDPPKLVRSIIAAIAREKLHKTRATLEVKEAADRARAQLVDISRGLLTLPIAAGSTAPASAIDREAVTSGDGAGNRFSEILDDFTRISPAYDPAWRR